MRAFSTLLLGVPRGASTDTHAPTDTNTPVSEPIANGHAAATFVPGAEVLCF